jgi:hypothetical protein
MELAQSIHHQPLVSALLQQWFSLRICRSLCACRNGAPQRMELAQSK